MGFFCLFSFKINGSASGLWEEGRGASHPILCCSYLPPPLPLNSLPVCQGSLKGVWSVWAGEKRPLLASFVGKGPCWAFIWLSRSSCSHRDPSRKDSGSQPSRLPFLLGLRAHLGQPLGSSTPADTAFGRGGVAKPHHPKCSCCPPSPGLARLKLPGISQEGQRLRTFLWQHYEAAWEGDTGDLRGLLGHGLGAHRIQESPAIYGRHLGAE